MNRLPVISLALLFLPSFATAVDIEAAIQDMCQCGFPPSTRCMDDMARKYPAIDKDPRLQDQVMKGYNDRCGMGAIFGGKGKGGQRGLPLGAATGNSVANTSDCATASFSVAIPQGWQCRKLTSNAQDVTLFAYGNRLNVTLGRNQGQTSCSVIPICNSEPYELVSGFETTLFTNPMVGSHEYAGIYKKDSTFKLTITSNTKPNGKQLGEIKAILESFAKK